MKATQFPTPAHSAANRRAIKSAAYGRMNGGRAASLGFSLMEIIIVVVLIGAIATFAFSRILGGADRAKAHLVQAQVDTLAGKVEQYQQDVGSLPPNLEALVKAPGNSTGWLGPYAKDAELKDPWGNAFVYKVPGESGGYDLMSYGKDGKPGGDSYDADVSHK